jgi:hypothetical protein
MSKTTFDYFEYFIFPVAMVHGKIDFEVLSLRLWSLRPLGIKKSE